MKVAATLLGLALAALGPTHLVAAEDPPPPGAAHGTDDNGTDPHRVSRTATTGAWS
jgi:hypothetical protein